MWYIHLHSTISNIEFPAISRVPKGKWQTQLTVVDIKMTTLNMESKRCQLPHISPIFWAIWVYQSKLCPKNPVVSYLTQNPLPQFWHTQHTKKKNMICVASNLTPWKRPDFTNFTEKPRWLAMGEVSMPSLVSTPVSTTFKGLDISSSLSPNLRELFKVEWCLVFLWGSPSVYIRSDLHLYIIKIHTVYIATVVFTLL